MTLQEFIQAFEEALEIPAGEIKPETRLNDVARYDSMGRLSLMALADTKLGVMIDADEMEKCQTVADLHALMHKKA